MFLLQNGVMNICELMYYYHPSYTQELGFGVYMNNHVSFLPIPHVHTTESTYIENIWFNLKEL
jgi:hypothetical protein